MKDFDNQGSGESKLELDSRRGSDDLSSPFTQLRGRFSASGSSRRSILSSVKARTKRDTGFTQQAPGISTICDGPGAVLVNGHTDPVELRSLAISGPTSPLSKQKGLSNYSPRAFLQRRKHKLELSFGKHKSPGFVKTDLPATTAKHSELHLSSLKHFQNANSAGTSAALQKGPVRNKSSLSLASKPSFKTEQQTAEQEHAAVPGPSPSRCVQNADDEHELIAFCSALLHVSPMTSSTTINPANYTQSTLNNLTIAQPAPKPFPPPPPSKQLLEQSTSDSFRFESDDFPPPSPPPIPANKPRLSPIMGSPYPQSETHSPPASKEGEASASTSEPLDAPQGSEDSREGRPSVPAVKTERNRICTSFRIYIPVLKNPVDACLLPNDNYAIADYDNGFVILSSSGEVLQHKNSPDDKNACGIACIPELPIRLYVLVFKEGAWSINVYENYSLTDSVQCPTDNQIESWALRKIGICSPASLHLMASGETKVTIWIYSFGTKCWSILATENSRRGGYNDISLRVDPGPPEELNVLLCDWRKSQLCTVSFSNDKHELLEQRSIKVRRVKGQEWVVQGPTLAVLDEQSDILVYDASGKLFFFDGDTNKCKKIVADIGRGEVSALFVKNGWIYVLCRYRLCLEVYLYKEFSETVL